jgi:nucleoside-diphosphate-sugar epimerase
MSTIVITGARGYIGSILASRLSGEGRALRLVSRSALVPPGRAGAKIEQVHGDLRDEACWRTLLDGAEAVVHLSSRTDLRAAEVDPKNDDNLNVEPVRALVRAAERCKTPMPVIFASTVTIVGWEHDNPVDEQTADRPCSVYDRHKLECETILRHATERGNLRACTLRLSNVYGYGGVSINANRGVLNVMLARALRGEPLTLFGDGAYVRDYTHVDDVVDAFCRAVVTPGIRDGRHYVISSGRGRTLAEAYALVKEAALEYADRRIDIRRIPEPPDLHPIERRNFIGNSRLFEQKTGWTPRFDLQAGIRDYFVRMLSRSAVETLQ